MGSPPIRTSEIPRIRQLSINPNKSISVACTAQDATDDLETALQLKHPNVEGSLPLPTLVPQASMSLKRSSDSLEDVI